MVDERSFANFIKWLLVSAVAGAVLVALFVVVVDPYRTHTLIDIAGFNQVKPGLDRYQEEIKVAAAKKMRPDVFLMGNSRIEIGLDPESKEFDPARSAYNLAIPGTGIATTRRELEALRDAGHTPSVLVLGVEFFDFLVDPNGADEPPPPSRPGVLAQAKWKVDTVFSLSSVFDSVQTLKIQHNPEASTMTARGFNPLLEYKRYVREEGYHSLFKQRALENAKNILRKPHAVIQTRTGTSADWQDLGAVLDGAARKDADIHLIIYPYHAQILALFEQAGVWPVFEQWKMLLAREVARAAEKHPGARIKLWDFSGFSAIQCEPIPAKSDRSNSTKWYWEAGHFKSALGDVMMARALGSADARSAPPDFGVQLVAANLDDNARRIARERGACIAANPALFDDVATLVRSLQARQ